MPRITFRGAVLRYCDLRHEEGGKFVRLHMTADYTDVVRKEMEWDEVPESVTQAKLTGKLAASQMVLTPNGRELARHEIQIACNEVSDFTFVRVTEDESSREELRFIVRSNQPGAAAMVEGYIENIGKGAGQLRVGYEVQSNLPIEEAPAKGKPSEAVVQ